MIVGLTNTGNSCYFNAALQCLINDKLFIRVINSPELNDIIIISIIKKIKNSRSHECDIYVSGLKRHMAQKYEIFRTDEQQDAHEAIINIFDAINNECKHINNISHWPDYNIVKFQKDAEFVIPDATKVFQDYNKIFGYSFINTLYCGQFITRFDCNNCHHKTYTYDIFNEIFLDVPQNHSDPINIHNLFNDFVKPQNLIDYSCDKCHGKNVTQSKSIFYLPRRLILVINRFNQSPYKILRTINIDKNIKIQTEKNNYSYNLLSIVNHAGPSPYGGHYYDEIFIDNMRYLVNDNSVQQLNNNDPVMSNNSYIIIYSLEEKVPIH